MMMKLAFLSRQGGIGGEKSGMNVEYRIMNVE